ncbi:hypothetical protein U0070_018406 [Myodes glareolus]|uniref:Follicular dendritic cell secreted protein n=1 Tax=Myodes glareolus TaxID=447135 RepID=A0AAW0JWE2_MYOGA
MKALLVFSVILAVAACLPVSQDQAREKRSASDSDEFFPRIYFPPYRYPPGAYPPYGYPGYPWFYAPFPIPFSPPATPTPNEK